MKCCITSARQEPHRKRECGGRREAHRVGSRDLITLSCAGLICAVLQSVRFSTFDYGAGR